MELLELKKRISDYQNGQIYNDNSDFVSLLVVECYFKKKFQEYLDKTVDFTRYLEQLVKFKIDKIVPYEDYLGNFCIKIEGQKHILTYTSDHTITIVSDNLSADWTIFDRKDVKHKKTSMFIDDSQVQEYIAFLKKFIELYDMCCFRKSTDAGLFVDMYFDTFSRVFVINVSDNNNSTYKMPCPFNIANIDKEKDVHKNDTNCNFRYFKNVLGGENGFNIDYDKARNSENIGVLSIFYPHLAVDSTNVYFGNTEGQSFLTRELLEKVYSCLKVDPSGFSKSVQEELRQLEEVNRTKLSEEMKDNLASLKEMQIAKLMKAYKLIKEATELLDGLKTTIDFELIKLDNLASILFKNGGIPNGQGCIEFEEFFKNNTVLRMLDLSNLDLTDVDIRGIDFSGTNIHIDPQRVYNKDMTDVNAAGISFSPFLDSFEGVIIDGAIITDREAAIDLNAVQSYNNRTVIKEENVKKL